MAVRKNSQKLLRPIISSERSQEVRPLNPSTVKLVSATRGNSQGSTLMKFWQCLSKFLGRLRIAIFIFRKLFFDRVFFFPFFSSNRCRCTERRRKEVRDVCGVHTQGLTVFWVVYGRAELVLPSVIICRAVRQSFCSSFFDCFFVERAIQCGMLFFNYRVILLIYIYHYFPLSISCRFTHSFTHSLFI